MGAELFHSDGQMDMTKLIVACHNFANAPNTVRDEEECTRLWLVWFHGDFRVQKHWNWNLGTENGMLPADRLPNGEKILPECTKQNTYWIGAMSAPYLERIASVIPVRL